MTAAKELKEPKMEKKRVLLIAGTGTLGGSAYPELVKMGYAVDVVSLEAFESVTPALNFIQARADTAYLADFLAGKR